MISDFQQIQICKQRCTGQSPVCRYNCMSTFSAYGKRTSLQMSRCLFQHLFICRVIYRKGNSYLRNLHRSHDAVARQIQGRHVFFVLFRSLRHCEGIRKNRRQQFFIILLGLQPFSFIIYRSSGCLFTDHFVIAADQLFLPVCIPLVCHKRIQQQGQPG